MLRLYLVLAIALVVESVGNVYITKGMKELGEVQIRSLESVASTVRRGATNVHLLGGVALLAVFFGLFLAMLSWADITVVLPLTSIGYILTAIFAQWLLHEQVSGVRWFGTLLIVVGVYFIQKSDRPIPAKETRSLPSHSLQNQQDL